MRLGSEVMVNNGLCATGPYVVHSMILTEEWDPTLNVITRETEYRASQLVMDSDGWIRKKLTIRFHGYDIGKKIIPVLDKSEGEQLSMLS